MFADTHPEELMHGAEDGDGGLSFSGSEAGVRVPPRERGDEVDPPRMSPSICTEPGEHAEGHGERNDSPESEHLPEPGRRRGLRRSPESIEGRQQGSGYDPRRGTGSRISVAGLLRISG